MLYACIAALISAAACTASRHTTALAPSSTTLDVMTFNIRYAHTQPPNLWPDRLPVIKEMVERRRPDIIGTQEGLHHQLLDLEKSLPAYAWIGVGRDGGTKGEFMAVFYRRDRFDPLESSNYWLSDTPAIPGSRTWGNNYPRMVTSVKFRDRATGRDLLFVNTHFDHEVQASREKSAAMIVDRLSGTPADMPIILLGDFNAGAGENPIYDVLTRNSGFTDSWVAVGNADTLGTYHAFNGVPAARGVRRIDWILLRGPVTAVSSEIITDARNGQLPSDHFPVMTRVRLTEKKKSAE